MKKETVKSEKGFVLVLALMTMLAMTLIGLSVVMSMTTDMQLSRNEKDAKLAFQLAEAGIREASARLHLTSTNANYIGEKSTDTGYRTTSWNLNNSLGKDIGYNVGGSRNSADNLNYSVSIRYLDEANPEGFCDSNNTDSNEPATASSPPAACSNSPAEVVMYGRDFNLDSAITYINYGTLPVYKITSVGTSNGTTRTIVAYLGESNLNTDTEYPLSTNGCVQVNGGSNSLTGDPSVSGSDVVMQGSGCACDPALSLSCTNSTTATDMNTYLGDTLANIATYSDEYHSCKNASCNAAGDDIPTNGRLDNGVVQNWSGTGANEGVLLYIDNSGGADAKISGSLTGEGILIVTGNLEISGNVTWEGLIYVVGTLTVSGSVVNDGGIMTGNTVTLNGSVTVNYDREELLEMARQTSTSATMVWKRL
ncbi:MAG: hypothetical protein HY954_05745 [Deltaproteobacteria bacterium]|nr:hypothetical protein [Deltaproteobacteria bacterium]